MVVVPGAPAALICRVGAMRSLATSALRMGDTYGSTSRGHALMSRPSRCALPARRASDRTLKVAPQHLKKHLDKMAIQLLEKFPKL